MVDPQWISTCVEKAVRGDFVLHTKVHAKLYRKLKTPLSVVFYQLSIHHVNKKTQSTQDTPLFREWCK